MQKNSPKSIIETLFTDSKGILAADESNKSANKRLHALGVAESKPNRRDWRELLLTTPDFSNYISGVILYDETIHQSMQSGQTFVEYLSSLGVVVGIKVDSGLVDMPNFEHETITEGLDGLVERLLVYYQIGARFTKWRSAFVIDNNLRLPTSTCIHANLNNMARYAAIAQNANLVPIVEPEILFEGQHSILEAQQVTSMVLRVLFDSLKAYRVDVSGLILKTSMVLAGSGVKKQSKPQEVADHTLHVLKHRVPEQVGGIVFLSGGQTPDQTLQNFNAIGKNSQNLPWPISFSFSRALQQEAMSIWKGQSNNTTEAQKMFETRLRQSYAARRGEYIA